MPPRHGLPDHLLTYLNTSIHSDLSVPALPETVAEDHLSGTPVILGFSVTLFLNHGSRVPSL